MELHYCAGADSLHIELASLPGVETREFADGLNAAFDAVGAWKAKQ